ncbi:MULTISPECIES: sensor histidine kinase [Streptomyces]|uniref:histidine kinase n=1 Tax=Streptomyces venezuelae (strain ATCC 10712 / CBS 650.69 / DSM 40230 / JCM 4526 / NBRC 13096 / PD 04745) TaxID=953739 RepID=F2RLT1_STRVP|nr:HAMP domain-containing sensor histidine kinase [Streptomyces venezuelae]APE25779.1 two-component sensor histidine kinase [Streptomyces venezuelae]QES03114.1 sensor histidine kinase [Streptomyces venezuelae ATCC 10712]CCA60461.1 putative two-component system sensor kinase [Streptomyces venezuelae ATCC 10712]
MTPVRALLNLRSLRWKIVLLVGLACTAMALTVGVLVHESTLRRSMHEGAGKALAALDPVVREGTTTQPTALPDVLLRQVRRDGTATLYDNRPPAPVFWAARTQDGQLYATRVDMTADLLTRQALDRHMWKYSLLTLGIVVPVAVLATELPARRLRRVARTARRITAGDLDARTETSRGGVDEIGEIGAVVDSMADSLQQRIATEQRFTADVAHELRTPLMGLVTSAGLLPEGEVTDMVRDRIGVLRDLIEDLLEISRLDAGAEEAQFRPVVLAELVRESVARTGTTARVTADEPAVADTDPRRLDRIVANLAVNAHRHGAGPVEITVSGRTITVRDHGPGFPADLLADGPQRFRTGSAERGRGHGLGLTIASGQAAVIGAALSFANHPEDGGAVATLRLPAECRGASGVSGTSGT